MKGVIVFIAVLVLAGCGGSTNATKESPGRTVPRDEDLQTYEKEFRPSDHEPDVREGGEANVLPPLPGKIGPRTDSAVASDEELVPGFRVQIFATADIDAAQQRKAEAENLFPDEVFYMQYDPPVYKIRGGNFKQRYEADRFARLAIDRGYPESWVVPEHVVKSPPAPSLR
jgi:hypothetical protein